MRTRDGRWLRTMAAGPVGTDESQAGGDLVVLEAGLGFSGLYWEPVQRLLAQQFRVVAYDRSGFGGSAADPHPRTLDRLAADLVDVVGAFPHERLILVGHSWGGPIVRAAARTLRADGLVLVDPTDEHADLYFEDGTEARARLNGRLSGVLARVGLLRLALHAMGTGLPGPVRAAAARASGTPAAAAASEREMLAFTGDLSALRQTGWEPQRVPVRLVSGIMPGLGEGEGRAQLVAAHRRTAQTNPDVTLVEATKSSHLVPLTEPGLVAQQVEELLED